MAVALSVGEAKCSSSGEVLAWTHPPAEWIPEALVNAPVEEAPLTIEVALASAPRVSRPDGAPLPFARRLLR